MELLRDLEPEVFRALMEHARKAKMPWCDAPDIGDISIEELCAWIEASIEDCKLKKAET